MLKHIGVLTSLTEVRRWSLRNGSQFSSNARALFGMLAKRITKFHSDSKVEWQHEATLLALLDCSKLVSLTVGAMMLSRLPPEFMLTRLRSISVFPSVANLEWLARNTGNLVSVTLQPAHTVLYLLEATKRLDAVRKLAEANKATLKRLSIGSQILQLAGPSLGGLSDRSTESVIRKLDEILPPRGILLEQGDFPSLAHFLRLRGSTEERVRQKFFALFSHLAPLKQVGLILAVLDQHDSPGSDFKYKIRRNLVPTAEIVLAKIPEQQVLSSVDCALLYAQLTADAANVTARQEPRRAQEFRAKLKECLARSQPLLSLRWCSFGIPAEFARAVLSPPVLTKLLPAVAPHFLDGSINGFDFPATQVASIFESPLLDLPHALLSRPASRVQLLKLWVRAANSELSESLFTALFRLLCIAAENSIVANHESEERVTACAFLLNSAGPQRCPQAMRAFFQVFPRFWSPNLKESQLHLLSTVSRCSLADSGEPLALVALFYELMMTAYSASPSLVSDLSAMLWDALMPHFEAAIDAPSRDVLIGKTLEICVPPTEFFERGRRSSEFSATGSSLAAAWKSLEDGVHRLSQPPIGRE